MSLESARGAVLVPKSFPLSATAALKKDERFFLKGHFSAGASSGAAFAIGTATSFGYIGSDIIAHDVRSYDEDTHMPRHNRTNLHPRALLD
ncbi:hypothetical protein [Sphingobium cupriresistens]|uniref:hypothetical protein n=1 Tax=Sphingobium cupriresistens TaxID=1132417 RepID=UPI003BF4BED3